MREICQSCFVLTRVDDVSVRSCALVEGQSSSSCICVGTYLQLSVLPVSLQFFTMGAAQSGFPRARGRWFQELHRLDSGSDIHRCACQLARSLNWPTHLGLFIVHHASRSLLIGPGQGSRVTLRSHPGVCRERGRLAADWLRSDALC